MCKKKKSQRKCSFYTSPLRSLTLGMYARHCVIAIEPRKGKKKIIFFKKPIFHRRRQHETVFLIFAPIWFPFSLLLFFTYTCGSYILLFFILWVNSTVKWLKLWLQDLCSRLRLLRIYEIRGGMSFVKIKYNNFAINPLTFL